MQSDFNKVKFELEKYKGENVILKKQNEVLHVYLQDSQVQLKKEKEKVSEKAKFIDSPEESDSDSSSSSSNEGSGSECGTHTLSTTLQTNNSEKWPHKDKHTQNIRNPKSTRKQEGLHANESTNAHSKYGFEPHSSLT